MRSRVGREESQRQKKRNKHEHKKEDSDRNPKRQKQRGPGKKYAQGLSTVADQGGEWLCGGDCSQLEQTWTFVKLNTGTIQATATSI